MENLDLVPTEELVDELLRRSDHAVISLLRVRTGQATEAESYWAGNAYTAIGLCHALQDRICAANIRREPGAAG